MIWSHPANTLQRKRARGLIVTERNVLHRIDGVGQPLHKLERLVFGDVGVVQDEGEFVAKNLHASKQFSQIVIVKVSEPRAWFPYLQAGLIRDWPVMWSPRPAVV